jgi:vitamin B12 transporter
MRRKLLPVILLATMIGASKGAGYAAGPSHGQASPTSSASPAPTSSPTPGAATGSQQSKKKEPQKLPPVVVTATRIEQPISEIGTTVTVVDDEQIQSQKIQSVENVLRQVPGVVVTQSGSPGTIADVSIRGSTPSQTLIMVDGVELNTGSTGEFDISGLTTPQLDRVEVVRGAGGALYGSQAIGGVINLITQEGEGAPKFSLLSEGGNRATERQVFTANGSEGRLGYSGALSYFSTEGFQKLNDNSDNLSGALRLDYHLDEDTTVRGFARYIRSNTSLPDFSVFSGSPLNPNAHQRGEFMLFKGEIERRITKRLTARVNAFFVRNEVRLNEVPFTGNPSSEDDRIPDEMRGANAEAVYSWTDDWRSLAGFDFKDRWVRSDSISVFPPSTFTSLFRARRQEYAGYYQQQGSALDGHILGTAGFRVDGNSQFGTEVSPSWSVAIPVKQIDTTFRGSYSEGFRAPSFDELFFPNFGNPDLQPEISSEYDGGFTKAFGEYASFTATYFSRRIHHLIVTVPCATCLFGSEAGNAGRVDVQGVELVPSVGPFYGFTLSGGFTLLDETHDSGRSSARPLRVPKRSAFGVAQYDRRAVLVPSDRIILSVAYVFVGDRDDITTLSTIANHAAYHRFDATLSYAAHMPWAFITNEEVFSRISNLFDRHYSEAFGFPAPPINAVAGIKVEFE